MVRVETSASTVSGGRLGRATGGDGTFFLALDGRCLRESRTIVEHRHDKARG